MLLQIIASDGNSRAAAMHALESCTMLGGRDFVVHYGEQMAAAVAGALPSISEGRDLRATAQLLDTAALFVPVEAPQLFASCLGPLARVVIENTAADFTVVEVLILFARLLFAARESTLQVLGAIAGEFGVGAGQFVGQIVSVWADKSDCVLTAERKLLSGCALASLLLVQDEAVLQHAGDIINVGIGVALALEDASQRKPPATAMEAKRRQAYETTLRGANMTTVLVQRLQECQAALGDAKFQQLMATVDPAIMGQLQQLGGSATLAQ